MRNTLPEKIAFCYFVYSWVMTSIVQILKALVIFVDQLKMSLYTCLIKSNLSFRILLMKNLYVVIFLHYLLWELDSEVQAVRCIFHRTGVPNPQAMDQYSGLLKTGPHSRGWVAC